MSNKCLKCNRELKNEKAKSIGFGEVCLRKLKREETRKENEINQRILIPPREHNPGEYVFVKREANTVKSNIPRTINHHSPSGFNYGYPGSGASELALNIMNFYYPGNKQKVGEYSVSEITFRLYQRFKEEFIAIQKEDSFKIDTKDIKCWVEKNEIYI